MRTLLTFGIAVLMSICFVPPAQASGSCSTSSLTSTNTCTIYWCYTGERLSVTVSGLSASGTVTGCGQSASCSTGLSLTCTAYSSPIGSGYTYGSYGYCSVSGINAAAACASA